MKKSMPNKEEINSKDVLFKETLASFENDTRLTLILLICFFLLTFFLRFILRLPIPIPVFITLFAWGLLYFSHSFFIKRKKNQEELYDFYFRNNIIDIFLLTVIIHYLGGAEWIGVIFYTLTIALSGNFLPRKKTYISCVIAVFFYSTLLLLEYFQILPHRDLFAPSSGLYRNHIYILAQILISAAVFFFIGGSCGSFSEKLKKKQKESIDAQKEINEAREILEVKVKARTRELRELAEKQENIINERTKEVQDRVEELERFQKLAVGRELKMIELKDEIEVARKQLGILDDKNKKH